MSNLGKDLHRILTRYFQTAEAPPLDDINTLVYAAEQYYLANYTNTLYKTWDA